MRFTKTIAGAMTAVAMLAAPALAVEKDAGEHKFEKAVAYYTECQNASAAEFNSIKPYLKAFTDAEVMAETMNDPARFFKLMEVVNDPRTVHVMANCATEPVMWNTWLNGMTNYEKMAAAGIKAMNPAGMVKWMMAPLNMDLWKSAASHLDVNRYVRWGKAFLNPKFYRPATDMLTDYKWYAPRLAWFVQAETYTRPLANLVTMPDFGRLGSELGKVVDDTAKLASIAN